MSNLLIMEAANLFCGDDDPSNSLHLELSELKLPGLEENYSDYMPGGAPVAIEIDTHINRLEATFNLMGWNKKVMTMIGASSQAQQTFTAYGVIRDRRSGKALGSKAIMFGRLGRVNPQAYSRGNVQQHEYSIRGIMHYELYLDHEQFYYWDYFTNTRRIGGINFNLELNRLLQIPGASGGTI